MSLYNVITPIEEMTNLALMMEAIEEVIADQTLPDARWPSSVMVKALSTWEMFEAIRSDIDERGKALFAHPYVAAVRAETIKKERFAVRSLIVPGGVQ